MKISELIQKLQEAMNQYGDIHVKTDEPIGTGDHVGIDDWLVGQNYQPTYIYVCSELPDDLPEGMYPGEVISEDDEPVTEKQIRSGELSYEKFWGMGE